MSEIMMHLAAQVKDRPAFKTGCENFIQESSGKVMRLEHHQAEALYEAYPTAKEDVLADLLGLSLELPDEMLVYAKRVYSR